jgi:hypothetical protein
MKKITFLLLLLPFLRGQSQTKTVDIKKADSSFSEKRNLILLYQTFLPLKAIGADPVISYASSAKQFALSFSNFAAIDFKAYPKI